MSASQQIDRLKKLYELSMKLSGDPMDIFVHLARMIGELLEVEAVCLAEIRDRELYFLSVWVQGTIFVNAGHFPLEMTPCATVEQSKSLRIYDRVMERFPQASFLREYNAFSYCGFPSLDNDGKVRAVTCLLDDKPHDFSLEDQELLRIAGQRIGLEIARKRLNDERQTALAALQDSEARLRDVLDAAGDFIWEVDTAGHLTYLTPGVVEKFGHCIDELLGCIPFASPRADDISGAQCHFSSAVREKRQIRGLEYRILTGTGKVIWVSVSGTPLLDSQNKVIGFRGTVSDITERKSAEQALRDSEERMQRVLQGADLGLWDWDIQSGGVYFNDRWSLMLGYAPEEMEPNYDQWARLIHPDDMPGVFSLLEAHLAGTLPCYEVEHRLLTKQGQWKWVWSSGKVLERDAAGVPLRAAGIHLDISGRKALEDHQRRQQAALADARRLTTAAELAATISDELKQPLGAIANYAGAARLEFAELLNTHPGLQRAMDDIERSTRRAADVVRGIRDRVRGSAVAREWVDLHAVLDDVLVYFGGELTRRHIRLVLQLPPTLPCIRGDRIQLQQLFLNLILNAMDALESVDPSHRQLSLRATPGPAGVITLLISDTGPGIAPDIMARLFDPFVTDKPNGIGLGLSLCRTIAEAHDGKIALRSARRHGASFELTLPLATSEGSCAGEACG